MTKDLFLKKVDCYCTGAGIGNKVVARAIIYVQGEHYPEQEELECSDPLDSKEVQSLYAIIKERLWEKVKDKEWMSINNHPYISVKID